MAFKHVVRAPVGRVGEDIVDAALHVAFDEEPRAREVRGPAGEGGEFLVPDVDVAAWFGGQGSLYVSIGQIKGD